MIVHELCISQGNNNNLRHSYSGRKWDINNSEVRGSRRKLSDNLQNKLFCWKEFWFLNFLVFCWTIDIWIGCFLLIILNIIIEGNFRICFSSWFSFSTGVKMTDISVKCRKCLPVTRIRWNFGQFFVLNIWPGQSFIHCLEMAKVSLILYSLLNIMGTILAVDCNKPWTLNQLEMVIRVSNQLDDPLKLLKVSLITFSLTIVEWNPLGKSSKKSHGPQTLPLCVTNKENRILALF